MYKKLIKHKQEIFKLSTLWLYETVAYILLPLLIYVILFISTGGQIYNLYKLPEWMFITIILYGDTIRKLILLYVKFDNFELRINRTIAQAIIAIVLTSTFLVIQLISQQKNIELASYFFYGQFIIFLHAIWFSLSTSVRYGLVNNDGQKIKKLDIFSKGKTDNAS